MIQKGKKGLYWGMVLILFLSISLMYRVSNADIRKEIDYPGDPQDVFYFIHITDTHISDEQICGAGDSVYDRILAYDNFQSFINDVLPTIDPEFVVNTGDLVEEFSPLPFRNFEPHFLEWDEYESLMYQLNARFPLSKYYDIPGNHDRYRDLGWDGEDDYPVDNGYKYMGVRGSYSAYPGVTNKSDENTEGQFHWSHLQDSDRYEFITVNTCDEAAVSSSEYNLSWIPDSEGGGLYNEDLYSDFPQISNAELKNIDENLSTFNDDANSKLSFLFGHHAFETEENAVVSYLDMVLPGLYDEEGKVVAKWTNLNENRSEITLNSNSGFPNTGAAFIKTKPPGCNTYTCWEMFTWQGKNGNKLTGCSYIPVESALNDSHIVYYNKNDRGKQDLVNLMKQYEVSAYFYGHTHFDHDDSDGLIRVYDEDILTINTGDLSRHGFYRLVAIDNGGLSTTVATLHDWPIILITAPVAKYFENSATMNPFRQSVKIQPSVIVRALGFGIGNKSGLEFRVEAFCSTSDWIPMTKVEDANHLYQGTWDFSNLYETEYTISVREIGDDSTKRFIKVDLVSVAETTMDPEIIGTWSSGIRYWDVAALKWTRMTFSPPPGDIAAGDFTGDGKADVASIWESGLWYQDGATLDWTKVTSSAPVSLTAGDVTGDGRFEIIGNWSSGIWYWDVAASEWIKMSSGMPSGDIAAGDFTGDGKADVASVWASGLWYQDGATLAWTKVTGSAPESLTAGDVTGDGQAEIIGTWASGIWYWDVAASEWTQMSSGMPSGDIAAGDFTGDGKADVASIWGSSLWYQDGATLAWKKIWCTAPNKVAAGNITGASLFTEDWETGIIDSSKWDTGGSPKPTIVAEGHNSNYSLDHNGDSWCHSAAHTKDWFETEDGLTAEFWMKPYSCPGCEWSSIGAGFTEMQLTDNKYCSGENWYDLIARVRLNSKEEKITYSVTGLGTFYTEDYPDTDWHKYKIKIDSTGIVSFYRDDIHVAKSTSPIDLNTFNSTKFQVYGQASYGAMLIDDITITVP